jgi:hypothetical protein
MTTTRQRSEGAVKGGMGRVALCGWWLERDEPAGEGPAPDRSRVADCHRPDSGWASWQLDEEWRSWR